MMKPQLTLVEGGNPAQRQAAAWFARLRADDASEADRRHWREWMAQDPANAEAYACTERLWSSVGDFAAEPELERWLVASRARAAYAHRKPRGLWFCAAAAALAAVAISAIPLLRETATPTVAHHTALGERRLLQLDDGSRVHLDADSTLDVRYDRHVRRIVLRSGRAFFEVAKDPGRTFEVITAAGRVQALGTQFEVTRHSRAYDVALYEGKVALLAPGVDGAAPRRLGTLSPGQKARLDDGRMAMLPQTMAGSGPPAWLTGRLVFSNTPLSEAIADFNRYSAPPLVLADPAMARIRISGVFRSDDVEGFVEALHEVYGIRERHDGRGTHILSNPQ